MLVQLMNIKEIVFWIVLVGIIIMILIKNVCLVSLVVKYVPRIPFVPLVSLRHSNWMPMEIVFARTLLICLKVSVWVPEPVPVVIILIILIILANNARADVQNVLTFPLVYNVLIVHSWFIKANVIMFVLWVTLRIPWERNVSLVLTLDVLPVLDLDLNRYVLLVWIPTFWRVLFVFVVEVNMIWMVLVILCVLMDIIRILIQWLVILVFRLTNGVRIVLQTLEWIKLCRLVNVSKVKYRLEIYVWMNLLDVLRLLINRLLLKNVLIVWMMSLVWIWLNHCLV